MEFLAGVVVGVLVGLWFSVWAFVEIDKDRAAGKPFTINGRVYQAVEIIEAPHA